MGLDLAAALLVAGCGGRVPAWQGHMATPVGGRLGKVSGGGGGGGGRVEGVAGDVIKVFSQNKVLQRFVEIFGTGFNSALRGAEPRGVFLVVPFSA